MDLNRLAARIVKDSTELEKDESGATPDPESVEGARRRGGLKGGRARAEKLTPEQRSESARRAARARWDKA